MENYFKKFRENIIGINQEFDSPYGRKKIIYADWIASGRLYEPIENTISNKIGPFVANTHTETNETGTLMTNAYNLAHKKIKEHVNADENDVIITSGFGMTAPFNKFIRILGLRNNMVNTFEEKPIVFTTHMEHHSNHIPWYESNVDVVILQPNKDLLVDLNELQAQLMKYKDRKIKIGCFTACSNITGIITPYYEMAKIMHENGGLCFIDFAALAPYDNIDMHPYDDKLKRLDAIFFSPHKFLGGPGSSGVLIFDSRLYDREAPDNPGGGTVNWTNPWGGHKYSENIEIREDGGTPGFLQAIKAALAIELKNEMGVGNIIKRENELVEIAFKELEKIPEVSILAENVKNRLGVISFYHENIHYNLFVKLLNDRFGIQVRGGCVCAGTYGHFLLHVTKERSKEITDKIDKGDLSDKPGWVRLSLHPTITNDELYSIIDAIKQIIKNIDDWKKDYIYSSSTNEFRHKDLPESQIYKVEYWFKL